MSETKHTPGPWSFDGRNRITTKSGEKLLLVGAALDMSRDTSEAKANAYLIAASPDLLDACKKLLMCSLPRDASGENWIREARAAIAKAEGRS